MKWIVRSLLVALLCLTGSGANSYWQSRSQVAISTSSLDPATTAWVAAVVSAGGTVSGGRQTVVDTYLKCLKAAPNGNLFTTVLDRYWLLAGEDAQSANVDMINLGTWTLHGGFSLAPSVGYTGNGSTGYGDSGYIPSSGGGHLTQNSATIGVQIQNNRTTGNSGYAFGSDDAGAFSKIINWLPLDGSGNTFPRVNSSASTGTTGVATVRHSWTLTRTGASVNTVYSDGTSLYTPNDTSTGVPTTSLFFGALDFNSGPFGFSTDQLSSFYFGGGMTTAQVADFEACQNAMMTLIGINVH